MISSFMVISVVTAAEERIKDVSKLGIKVATVAQKKQLRNQRKIGVEQLQKKQMQTDDREESTEEVRIPTRADLKRQQQKPEKLAIGAEVNALKTDLLKAYKVFKRKDKTTSSAVKFSNDVKKKVEEFFVKVRLIRAKNRGGLFNQIYFKNLKKINVW
jgi:hypothetical protein